VHGVSNLREHALLVEVDEEAHLRDEDVGIDRLEEEVDRAGPVAARDLARRRVPRRDDQDREQPAAREALEARRGLEAVDLGHAEVEDDEREIHPGSELDRFEPASHGDDRLPERFERCFQRQEIGRAVVDKENPSGRRAPNRLGRIVHGLDVSATSTPRRPPVALRFEARTPRQEGARTRDA
jgi:hypothetical protein